MVYFHQNNDSQKNTHKKTSANYVGLIKHFLFTPVYVTDFDISGLI